MWPGPNPATELGRNDSAGSPGACGFSPLSAQRVKDESGGGLQWHAQRGLSAGSWTVHSGLGCGGFVQDAPYLCPSPFYPSPSSPSSPFVSPFPSSRGANQAEQWPFGKRTTHPHPHPGTSYGVHTLCPAATRMTDLQYPLFFRRGSAGGAAPSRYLMCLGGYHG